MGSVIRSLRSDVCVISVYVDDIVVSRSDTKAALIDAVEKIKESASKASFPISTDKIQEPNHCIRAFNIDLFKGGLQVAEERMLDFRAHVIRNGDNVSSQAVIRYVKSVNEEQGKQLAAEIGL